MCTGAELAIAGLLASGAGTGLQMNAASQERQAMNDAVAQQLAQQQQFQQKGQAELQQSLAQNTPQAVKQQQAAGTTAAQQEYSKVNAIPLTVSSGAAPSFRDAIVGDTAGARTSLMNKEAAPLQGYSDQQVQQWINNLQSNTALRQNAALSQLAASTLPIQLQAAQNSQSGMAGLGSLLSSAGGLVGLYGTTLPKTAATAISPWGQSILNQAARQQQAGNAIANWAMNPQSYSFTGF